MICREARDRLDDYLEDALPPAERRRVEEHLSTCDACRSELASLGALLDTAHGLQERRTEPGRDLWPEIRGRLTRAEPEPGRWWRARLGIGGQRLLWPLAAGAVVLLIALALGTSPVSRWSPQRGDGSPASGGPTISGERDEAGLAEQIAALDSEVNAARQQVSRAAAGDSAAVRSWRTFDDNLRVLDRAIRESRAALEQDPGNPLLQKTILGAYQKQLDLLRWASRLVPQG